ncbi:MAG: H-type lectin domain-containing protein [Ignavibacteriaceae bacterium]|jgi:hypothetical protein|nr:MAG: hypothetical protein APF79_12730 [bacterium BRH_c32]MCK9280853.1 H-type lectin domain-containing protein [Melioribacteraceae bacterium]MDX9923271.1 H-type lectin domain-containing protein [Ignavibacteriaceae bacterium]
MRKLVLTIALFFAVGYFSQVLAQTQSGSFFFNQESKGFTLDKNEGKRVVEYEINFNKPFDKKPKVVLSTTLLDAAKDTKIRYSISASGVSRDGFVLKAEVWGDTQLTGIGGYWLAHIEE